MVGTVRPERPVAVTVAVALLWLDLALAVAKVVIVRPEAFREWVWNLGAIRPWQIPMLMAIYVACTLLVVGISRGRSWCRWAYFPVAVAGICWAVLGAIEMNAALDRLAEFPPVWEQPGEMDPYDGGPMPPGLFGMVPEEWMIVQHVIIIVEGLLLTAAMVLLFTQPSRRWFRKPEKPRAETAQGSSTASQ